MVILNTITMVSHVYGYLCLLPLNWLNEHRPIIGTLRSTRRQAQRRGLQNVKKQCKFKLSKRSHGKLTTVFYISSLFYDLQDATVMTELK